MKTPKEVKKGLKCCLDIDGECRNGCPYYESKECSKELKEDAVKYIRAAESQQWTDVREGLPKKAGKYIVQSKTGAIYTIRYDPEIFKRWPHFGKADAAYWMPLPERKKEENA